MLDYGWRNYIPELGRWGVMDQLSENYHMASPYAYVMNNPVSLIDPDGRNVHETATGWTFDGADISLIMSYLRNGGGVKHLTQELSVWGGGGGGGGTTSMYGGAISSFWSSFNSGGILGGVSVSGGYLSWWTNGAPASGNSIQGVDNHKTKIEQNSFNSFMKDWYSLVGKGNWFFGTSGSLSLFAGAVQSQNMYSKGLRKGVSGNYVLKGRNLSQFGGMPATKASTPISRIGRVAKFAGHVSFYLGVASDGIGVINYISNPNSPNAVHPAKALLNTGFGAAGNWGGSIGASLSTVYFGVDNFYPGGWPQLFDDGNMMQAELDEGFNQAGPYRINVFGAHEPK